ncbi:MAG: type VI secretion system lipoprotein TssJ [Desulfobacteraceae bacterium]
MASKLWPVLGLMFLLLSACASQPLPPPEWTYEKDAIEVHLKSDPKLNFDEGVPHTLLVCLYQLKDPNAFNQLSDDTDGIYKLLECGLFDASVATAKRIIVRPGKDMRVTLDRAAGAQYVAVVAGYYVLEKDRMVRLYEIPVIVEKKGFIKRTKIAKPGLLKVDIELGPAQIK